MPSFEPVDHDPFAGSPGLVPVDHDPFAESAAAAAPEAPVTAGGLYQAADRGVGDAASSLIGLPKAVSDLGARGIQGAANWVSDKLGVAPDTRDLSKPGLIKLPTSEEASQTIQNTVYGGAAPYEPQNRAERYARTGGEFALNALTPGGVATKVASVALPAAATEAVKERGGGALAQFGAGLVGGAGAAKLGNVVERLGAGALPSIEKGVAGNLVDLAEKQYRPLEKLALAVPTTAIDRSRISSGIENYLHGINYRRANAPETYAILDEIRAGNPGKGSDFGDLWNARRKLGNVHGEDGKAAGQARDVIDGLLEHKIPGIGTKLAEADKNYNALKVTQALSAKFQKATDQTGAIHSGLNLGNKLRTAAANIANNPNQTRYMNPIDVEALRRLSAGTNVQNATRYAGNLLGGGGGLGALVAGGLGAGYAADHPTEGGAGAILAGLALKRGYNRSIARQAQGIGQGVLARSPQAGVLGASYVPPMTTAGALGAGLPSGAIAGLLGYQPPANLR